MGFGEMLGVKVVKITPNEEMTLEELYDKIKDLPFAAGKPEYVKHGLNYIIAFPPEDRENQVWILKSKKTFQVQRSVIIAGVENMVKNSIKADVLNELSGGITGMISQFGGPKKACMAHVDDVAEKVKSVL